MLVYHRTTIVQARAIMKNGFSDEKWSFGLLDARTGQQLKSVGVWLTDRKPAQNEGPDGDAVLEVDLALSEESLHGFELEGVLEETRLWIVPSRLVNTHGKVRIGEVDPRTSWWYEAAADDEEGDER